MTTEKIMFLIILTGAMTLYITQRVSVIITALITIAALTLGGIIPIDSALSGFASPATIAIGAMFVLSAGLIKTGALEPLTTKLSKWSKGSYSRLLLLMALTIPIASAFTNNTPVVVMMVPVVMSLGRELKISPSKLLMPLSFFAILGGTCTLIGTSTNLLIDDFYRLEANQHLNIFDFTPLGIIVLLVGSAYIMLFGKKFLPNRDSLSALLPQARRSRYVTEVIVTKDSPLIGKTISETFPKKRSLKFVQLGREDEFHMAIKAGPMKIAEEDALIVEGHPRDLNDLISSQRVVLGTVLEDAMRVPMRTFSMTMFELVVLPDSPLIGEKVLHLKLNRLYGIKLLAIQRGGRHHRMEIRGMRLKAGDMLLAQGDDKGIDALKEGQDFLVIEEVAKTIPNRKKAPIAFGVMIGVVLMTTLTPYPLVVWALIGIVALVVTRCLGTDDCVHALDFNVLFLLIGTIPLGAALVETGLTKDLADFLVNAVGVDHPLILIGSIYLVTNVLTSLLSNTAVAVLMAPLALGLAVQTGINPKPLIMAVAFAASAAFATPIAYQTNIIVMGPAGYTFGDYLKFGVPLSLLIWIVATLMIPIIWPLY